MFVLVLVVVEGDGDILPIVVLCDDGIGEGHIPFGEIAGGGGAAVEAGVGLVVECSDSRSCAAAQLRTVTEHRVAVGVNRRRAPIGGGIDNIEIDTAVEHVGGVRDLRHVEIAKVEFRQCRAAIEHVLHVGDICRGEGASQV